MILSGCVKVEGARKGKIISTEICPVNGAEAKTLS